MYIKAKVFCAFAAKKNSNSNQSNMDFRFNIEAQEKDCNLWATEVSVAYIVIWRLMLWKLVIVANKPLKLFLQVDTVYKNCLKKLEKNMIYFQCKR